MTKEMTEKDLELIKSAESISYTDWSIIDNLISRADSIEAKKKLREIQLVKFRKEEYYNGSL